MILVEQHVIKENNKYYNTCDNLCFLSKNLYNQGLYNIRQYFFENNKYLNELKNYHLLKNTDEYKSLPAKVSCKVIKILDKNFKSFFKLLKNKDVKNKIPKYLNKKNGRFMVKYCIQALEYREFKKTGLIKLSKSEIKIKTKIKDWKLIKEVRIIPKNKYYVIEVVYEKKEKNNIKSDLIASIDLGINNLATITYNKKEYKPIIINGKPLKSINQYYNKSKSKLIGNKTTKKSIKLTNKRNNKIKDYLHKSSKLLVNHLVNNNVYLLIIGKNCNWKQDTSMGKVSNQNFQFIPHNTFIEMLKYKCKMEGIDVILQEESYTSKASFLNLDYIPTYKPNCKEEYSFSGYRKSRGLYKIKGKEGKLINADVNGSYNILRKAIPNVFTNGVEGFVVNPLVLTPKR
jgi:putative transposase